jgi:hypothetical protein
LTYTDNAASAGDQYYIITVTADGGREGSVGYVSAPSNIVTTT